MAIIKSLDDCFDFQSEYERAVDYIDHLSEIITDEKKKFESNDFYFNPGPFTCGSYKPFKEISDCLEDDFNTIIDMLYDLKIKIVVKFTKKAKDDLESYLYHLEANNREGSNKNEIDKVKIMIEDLKRYKGV